MPPEAANATLPKITVVTPSRNQGQFLEQCIRSVLDQSYPNLEYIIIDGASTDDSVEIIRRYQGSLSGWVSEPDQGQSDALNKGFRRATGELVAWLNADDFYLPDALHTVAGVYREQPGAPFYFGNGLRVNARGESKSAYFPKDSLRFNRDALRFGLNYILQPATFINRQSLSQVGGVASDLHYGLDTDLWLRLSALGEPLPVPALLAATREYGATKSSTGSFARVEELRQIAQTHTNMPMTPGVICYFLDTLYRQAQEQGDIFPASYRREILRFWGKTSLIMEQFGAAPNGFPLPPAQQHSALHRFRRALRVHLRNLLAGYGWMKGNDER
ncbi:MAG: hypothetical protein Kow0031_35960 [Anaerolineae bacterium]